MSAKRTRVILTSRFGRQRMTIREDDETVFVLDHGEKLAEGTSDVILAAERGFEADLGR
jgi:hypothetical protein